MTAYDVVIVGGGPAGLAAAVALRRAGAGRVAVFEREQELGGIPRHTNHTGFGLRDLHRVMSGPRYAQRYIQMAERAGVSLHPGVLATSFLAGAMIDVTRTGIQGLETVETRALLVATGVRERPRAARQIPGDRPAGVMTTGALQQLVRAKLPVGRRAVIVGAEHVSFSAVMTLAHAGCSTAALLTDQAHHQTYAPLAWATTGRRRIPIITEVTVVEIVGKRRVEAVVLSNGRRIACDTVVFTADWIPDHELARSAGLPIDPASRAISVSSGLHTSQSGVFAAGNVLHGAETAEVCAFDGCHAAHSIARWLGGGPWPDRPVPIVCDAPLIWSAPHALADTGAPRRRILLRTSAPVPRITARQGERELWVGRPHGTPEPLRSMWIPDTWRSEVDFAAGPITLTATLS